MCVCARASVHAEYCSLSIKGGYRDVQLQAEIAMTSVSSIVPAGIHVGIEATTAQFDKSSTEIVAIRIQKDTAVHDAVGGDGGGARSHVSKGEGGNDVEDVVSDSTFEMVLGNHLVSVGCGVAVDGREELDAVEELDVVQKSVTEVNKWLSARTSKARYFKYALRGSRVHFGAGEKGACEIQINLRSMSKIKAHGHSLFKTARSLEALSEMTFKWYGTADSEMWARVRSGTLHEVRATVFLPGLYYVTFIHRLAIEMLENVIGGVSANISVPSNTIAVL